MRLSAVAGYRELVLLTEEQRKELTGWAQSRTLPAGDVFRARLILALADGMTYEAVKSSLQTTAPTISRWKQRFEESGIEGLEPQHKGSKPRTATPAVQARVYRKVQQKPQDGSTQWSVRKLAAETGISRSSVHRILSQARLQPHRLERYMASDDPDFEKKAADVIGLYLEPPQHAAVFCVDEKTAIQALDRLDPVLPLSPGRAERHGFESYRHGTLSLYAAFNTRTGEVLGKTAERHTSAEFVAFLNDIVVNQPKSKEIHVIADNLSAHKTKRVAEFLAEHRNVHMHFTPTYSSWLNQVELWFSKIERDVIARGVFTSVPDLKRKLMRYIRHYNKAPKTVKWKYFDPSRRITSQSVVTSH